MDQPPEQRLGPQRHDTGLPIGAALAEVFLQPNLIGLVVGAVQLVKTFQTELSHGLTSQRYYQFDYIP